MARRLILIATIAIVLLMASVGGSYQQSEFSSVLDKQYTISDYTEHPIIEIVGDGELESAGFPGSGIYGDPYRIENLNITSDSNCIWIQNTTKFTEISNCYFSSQNSPSASAIRLRNTTNIVIQTSVILDKECGIDFHNTTDCLIEWCSFENVDLAIDGFDSINLTINKNSIERCVHAIYVTWSTQSSISGNIISSNITMISLENSNFTIVRDNTLDYKGTFYPVGILRSFAIIVVNNTLRGNDGYGFHLDKTNHTNVRNNTIERTKVGVTLLEVLNITIFDNMIEDSRVGISSFSCEVNVTLNNVHNATNYGIYLRECPDSQVSLNNVDESGSNGGIWIQESDGTVVTENIVSNSINDAFYIWSNSTTVMDNTIINAGTDSIRVMHCNASILYNYLEVSNDWGIVLHDCFEVQVIGNYHQDAGGITSEGGSYHSVIRDNTIINSINLGVRASSSNGCEIQNNTIIDCDEWGIDNWNANSTYISQNTIRNSKYNGIKISRSSICTVYDNDIYTTGEHAMKIDESSELILIIHNQIFNSSDQGIRVHQSSNCTFKENSIYGSSDNGFQIQESQFIEITNNAIYETMFTAINIDRSDFVDAFANYITGSGSKDIGVDDSHSCEIYLNAFTSDLVFPGEILDPVSVQWDNGSYGNFWNAYDGVDADFDGIGDTPFEIDHENEDNYPLMDISIVDVLRYLRSVPDIRISITLTPAEPTNETIVTIQATTTWITWVSHVVFSYSVDGGSWSNLNASLEGVVWEAQIPAQAAGSTVSYKVRVQNVLGNWCETQPYSYIVTEVEATTATSQSTGTETHIEGPDEFFVTMSILITSVTIISIIIVVLVIKLRSKPGRV